MHFLFRMVQRMRRSKQAGVSFVLLVLLVGIVGNAVTFYVFDGPENPDLTFGDALWYSIISVTTIGYGDLSSASLGARIGTILFIIILGLSSFSAALGLLVDGMMQLNFREIHGLSKIHSENHILIINFPDPTRVERIIHEIRIDEEYQDRDVVLVTDRIDTIPFDLKSFFFVQGSPLQVETLERAGLRSASMAIVLSTSHDDPSTDGQVASVLNMVEHINPGIKTVAECVDERHEILFRSTNCDSVVYSSQVINNLLVQEIQDDGIASLVTTLTQNQDFTFYSLSLDKPLGGNYQEAADKLRQRKSKLLSVMRDGTHHINCEELQSKSGDLLIYAGPKRLKLSDLQ